MSASSVKHNKKKKGGRRPARVVIQLRCPLETRSQLAAVAARWGCDWSEALRRLIERAALEYIGAIPETPPVLRGRPPKPKRNP